MTAREALKAFVDAIEWLEEGDTSGHIRKQFSILMSNARAVLARPERNCERFQVAAEALREWQSLVKAEPNTWDFRYNYWLFAPAEKRKGENDGSI